MASIRRIVKQNTIEFSDYGFTGSEWTAPLTTNSVLQNREILAKNIKVIYDAISDNPRFKYQTGFVRVDEVGIHNNLFKSIVSGAFADRAGIASNMTVTIEPRGRTNQDPLITFKSPQGAGSKDGTAFMEQFVVGGLETTTPKLLRSADVKHNIIATEFYNAAGDTANVGKDLKTILQALQTKRIDIAKSAETQFPTTGASFANLWGAIKTYLGISAGNNSAINVEVEWTRSESDTYVTNYVFTQTDSRTTYKVQAYVNTLGVFDLKLETGGAPTYRTGAVGLANYTGYTQNITTPNAWTDFSPARGTATIVAANTDGDVTISQIGDNTDTDPIFKFKEYVNIKQSNIHSFIFNVDYSASGITGSDTQAIDFRVVSIASGAIVAVGDINMFGRLTTKVIDKSAVFETISDTASIAAGYKIQIRSSIAGTATPIVISMTKARLTAVGK